MNDNSKGLSCKVCNEKIINKEGIHNYKTFESGKEVICGECFQKGWTWCKREECHNTFNINDKEIYCSEECYNIDCLNREKGMALMEEILDFQLNPLKKKKDI